MSQINTLKVYQLKDIIKQHLVKNPEIKLKTAIHKLNKLGLIGVIKKNKINLENYPDYPKSAPYSKANLNILKKYGKSQYTEEEQKKFLIKEEENKNMALVARKVKRNEGKEPLTLQKHQVNFIKQFIYSNLNGAVMFHGVGTGKTLTAVVCAYWYLKLYPNNRVICISPSALLFNFIEGMRQFGVPIKDNRYTFTTYEKYARMSKEKKNAKDCLLIVDEAHNLRTEIKSSTVIDPETSRILDKIPLTNKRGFNVLEYGALNADKVLLLTGTAFVNSIYDIENLIAMVDKREPLLKQTFSSNVMSSPSVITDYFSYRISYVPPVSNDNEFFPRKIEKLIALTMTENQSNNYNIQKSGKNPFFIQERLVNNTHFEGELNKKIEWCINKIIEESKQKFIIYTGMYDTGIKLLEDALKKKEIEFTRITGKETARKKEENKNLFNSYDIVNNVGCRVLLISKAGAEGVDTKNTQNIVLLDHQWNDALSEQIIARAIRYKSHHDFTDVKQRYVNVYRLFSIFKKDEELFKRIESKNVNFIKLNSEIKESVREEARLLKKENQQFLPTVQLMKSLKEGDTDKPFVPEVDYIPQKTRKGTFRKGKEEWIDDESQIRRGWKSYKNLIIEDKVKNTSYADTKRRKNWLIKNYAKWWSLYGTKPENATSSSIDLRLYILCQAKLANIKEFITYFGNDIVFTFEQYETELSKKIMEEKIKLGKDGLTDEEENDIYIKEFKNKKIDIRKRFFQNRKRTTKEQLQQYFTNPEIAKDLIKESNIATRTDERIRILEPTAGDGSLVNALLDYKKVNFHIDMMELDEDNRKKLKSLKGDGILNLFDHRNFLTHTSGELYDYIFMNPPFHLRKNENGLIQDTYDYDFVLRAYAMLKPGGHLHAIIGNSWIMNTARGSSTTYPDDNLLLKNLKDITKFKKQKDAIKFSNVQVSNTYFIHIKKEPFGIYTNTNDRILNTKYYIIQPDITIGQEIESGEKSLKDLITEKTEKINYTEAPPDNKTINVINKYDENEIGNVIRQIVSDYPSIIKDVYKDMNIIKDENKDILSNRFLETDKVKLRRQINDTFQTREQLLYFIDAVNHFIISPNKKRKNDVGMERNINDRYRYYPFYNKKKMGLLPGAGLPNNLKIAKAVILGRQDYPPKVRNILKKYGNEIIVSYKLKRTPVSKLLTTALSTVSMGEFGSRLKNSDYDELFHLFLEMTTQSGKRISVEKNEVIVMNVSPPSRPKEEVENITSNIPSGLTINSLMNNTRKRMGDSKFFNYSAKSSNCQDMILNILMSNNIGDISDRNFVKQDTDFLFENLPYLRKISNTITTIGARANVLTDGAGFKSKRKSKKKT
jgi:hypothetical protein